MNIKIDQLNSGYGTKVKCSIQMNQKENIHAIFISKYYVIYLQPCCFIFTSDKEAVACIL